MRLFAAILEQVSGGKKEKSKKVRMVSGTDVPYENWIQAWGITERMKRKKSTLIEGYELGMYLLIRELVQKYPNDVELGGLIRQVISKKISKESELSKVSV